MAAFREEELEKYIMNGATLVSDIDIEEKKDGFAQITKCIRIYLKKVDEKFNVLVDIFTPQYPHPKYEFEKIRKFEELNDAILYINNNYSKKFIDMKVSKDNYHDSFFTKR